MRPATETDLPEIVSIYNSTVASRVATADTEEVSCESRLAWFRRHEAEGSPILVHEEAGQVVAWTSLSAFYGRPAYQRTAEVGIYIREKFRERGLGSRLLSETIEIASKTGLKVLLAFIFTHNIISLRLFESRGFEQWGLLPDVAEMDGRQYSLLIMGTHIDY